MLETNVRHDVVETLLAEGKRVKLKAGGYSMYPFLKPKDYLVVENTPFATICLGDIVVFKRESRFIGHRVVDIREINNQPFLITCGDSCLKYDEPISKDLYLGKVIAFVREEKKVMITSRSSNFSLIKNYKNRTSVLFIRIIEKLRYMFVK